ncbi:hypothetical protein M404DRAFT_991495 [Pisolithus tinctorius Marx 270]|uniref:Uncharacterized protein n=1 Tax=Pisolithus tinctorius Marx 270 TaxID=870435 RepID=A0A0C3PYJ4_PISTI|nr:hypothetical protein M404DRAFT_991495 [Pisolithus tinctorius Marx 270]
MERQKRKVRKNRGYAQVSTDADVQRCNSRVRNQASGLRSGPDNRFPPFTRPGK